MSRFDETIEYLQILTDDIKEKAEKRVASLNDTDVEKINIIKDKTVALFDEASEKVKEAVNVLKNEDELNAFLKAVEQKCLQNKLLAVEKFDEILRDVVPSKQEEEKVEIKPVEVEEEIVNPYNDTVDDVVIKLVDITNEHKIIEQVNKELKKEEVATNKEVKEEAKATVNDDHYKMSDVINSIKVGNEAKEEVNFDEVINEINSEVLEPVKDEKAKTSIDTLLENNNIRYAADFIMSMKDNIVEFMEKPETKQVISDLELSALKAADKGLDFLIKVLDSNKEE